MIKGRASLSWRWTDATSAATTTDWVGAVCTRIEVGPPHCRPGATPLYASKDSKDSDSGESLSPSPSLPPPPPSLAPSFMFWRYICHCKVPPRETFSGQCWRALHPVAWKRRRRANLGRENISASPSPRILGEISSNVVGEKDDSDSPSTNGGSDGGEVVGTTAPLDAFWVRTVAQACWEDEAAPAVREATRVLLQVSEPTKKKNRIDMSFKQR